MTCGALMLTLTAAAQSKAKAKPTPVANASKPAAKKVSSKGKKAKSKKRVTRRRGQQAIAEERTLQIQEALVNAGYLKTEPSGKMDDATKQALARLQKDNGWQSKVVPDARALIKLGLGPDHSNLLNPDTAMLPGVSATASMQNAQ